MESSMKIAATLIAVALLAASSSGAMITAGAQDGSANPGRADVTQPLLLAYGPGNGDCDQAWDENGNEIKGDSCPDEESPEQEAPDDSGNADDSAYSNDSEYSEDEDEAGDEDGRAVMA
jgi:hypothetical protein